MTTNTEPVVGLADLNRGADEILSGFTDSGGTSLDFLGSASVDVKAATEFTERATASLGEIARGMDTDSAYAFGFIAGLAFGVSAARFAGQRAASDA